MGQDTDGAYQKQKSLTYNIAAKKRPLWQLPGNAWMHMDTSLSRNGKLVSRVETKSTVTKTSWCQLNILLVYEQALPFSVSNLIQLLIAAFDSIHPHSLINMTLAWPSLP